MSDPMLPEFTGTTNGSGCPNPDCEANGRYLRVVSREEMERMFPQLSDMDFAPLPPQATHVCDRCGYVFSGINEQYLDVTDADPVEDRPDVDIDEYDWDPDMAFETTVREAAIALVEGAPDTADRDEVVEAVERHIPGLSRDGASDILKAADREFDAPDVDAANFM